MTETEVRSLFLIAGFYVSAIWQTANGYWCGNLRELAEAAPVTLEYVGGETLLSRQQLDFINVARCCALSPWWLVRTEFGCIEIGWRKRVIEINWHDIGISCDITTDDVTKTGTLVHAWDMISAARYLHALHYSLTKEKQHAERAKSL